MLPLPGSPAWADGVLSWPGRWAPPGRWLGGGWVLGTTSAEAGQRLAISASSRP